MEKNLKSKIIFIISMVIFGTIAVFVKAINVSSGEIALYRAILAALIIGLYLLITKQRIQIKEVKKDLALIAISGMLMGFNWIFLFEAYKYTTVSVSTLAYYFAPIIVMIVCPLLLKEKLTKKQIICFILSTIGLVLIIGISDLSLNSRHTIGVLLGLSAALFYAAVIIINKYIKSISGIHRTLIQFLAAIIVLFPYVLITSGITINNLEINGWICLLIVGIVHTGITYCAYFSSLKNLKGQTVALLSYIDPFVAVLISFLMNEKMTFLQIIGGILIILGTILNEIKIKKY